MTSESQTHVPLKVINSLWGRLFQNPEYKKLTEALYERREVVRTTGLWGASQAFVLSGLFKKLDRQMVIITQSKQKAEALYQDIEAIYNLTVEQDKPEYDFGPEFDWQDNVKETATSIESFCHLMPSIDIFSATETTARRQSTQRGLHVLSKLREDEPALVIASIDAVLRLMLPVVSLQKNEIKLEIGTSSLSMDALIEKLNHLGYRREETVYRTGDFCVRGGIIDVYIPSHLYPIRIEYFDDDIETIREFDPESQRSISMLLSVKIIPASELLHDEADRETILGKLEKATSEQRISEDKALRLLEALRTRHFDDDMERLAAMFYDQLSSFFDYLHPKALITFIEPDAIDARVEELNEGYLNYYRGVEEKVYEDVSQVILGAEDFQEAIGKFQRLEVELFEGITDTDDAPAFHWKVKGVPAFKGRLNDLVKDLQSFVTDYRHIVLVTPNYGLQNGLKKEIIDLELEEFLDFSETDDEFKTRISVVIGDLSNGFGLPNVGVVVLGSQDIYGEKKKQVKSRPSRVISSLRDLKIGDHLVHVDHGVGQYMGLKTLDVGGYEMDFMHIVYSGNDKLYLPMESLHLVQKYIGGDSSRVRLDKLGGTSWAKVKEHVKESIREMAVELLNLYAARKVVKGHAFTEDSHWMSEFEAAFEYEETYDQLKAIEDVKNDMEEPSPTDRLICGDVGYGKTEVAMRAAFKAAMQGKQVAVLTPTTILAQQHLTTFKKRFAAFPLEIDMLSRFRSRKEIRDILQRLAEGDIDILIGTHRILGKDVNFKDLGLLIIDEEQRFGVKHKETLKRYRTKVDVLTMTATPIPRTLHMAAMGLKDISIINTAPENRLPIKTYIRKFSPEIIRDAIRQELNRGGQVYFVHNRVESIDSMARFVQKMVPDANIAIGHGQMKEADLEDVMMRFLNREFDILVSTTIIESGLDIPTVNTIIINRADRFGLAQLYQLRGRVGRERTQAHAFLLIPPESLLSDIAKKRLRVIQELTDLGSGFRLAAYDLEIRGAGNLLGAEQHGQISAVGFDLYCKLIEDTIAELKNEDVESGFEPQITFPFPGGIPKSYIPDTNLRLSYYQRLSLARSQVELMNIGEEMQDRFGRFPPLVELYMNKMEMRMSCFKYKIKRCEVTGRKAVLVFDEMTRVEPKSLLDLALKRGDVKLVPERSLQVDVSDVKEENLVHHIQAVLTELELVSA